MRRVHRAVKNHDTFIIPTFTVSVFRDHVWVFILFLFFVLFLHTNLSVAQSSKDHQLNYRVSFDRDNAIARVAIEVPNNNWLKAVSFDISNRRISNLTTCDKPIETQGTFITWHPAMGATGCLKYDVSIPEPKSHGAFSAFISSDWLIMRAEDLVPPFKSRFKKGHRAEAVLSFDLPAEWTSVNTGYKRHGEHQFLLGEGERVPNPTGWIIAGKGLSTRHDRFAYTAISVSGPRDQNIKPTEIMTFIGLTWGQLAKLVGEMPSKLLIVSAGDPMWRGGLSSPNGLFMHASRPLVSENGTSTLIHELMHVTTGIRGAKNADWIAEGLAEFYSVELIYRAGGHSPSRRNLVFDDLANWGREAKCLNVKNSTGAITAKATVLFAHLNDEIKRVTKNKYSLDDLLRLNLNNKQASLLQLKKQYKELTGVHSKVLKANFLNCEHPVNTN